MRVCVYHLLLAEFVLMFDCESDRNGSIDDDRADAVAAPTVRVVGDDSDGDGGDDSALVFGDGGTERECVSVVSAFADV